MAETTGDNLLALSNLQGTVIIDNKTSYSGVDIKAVVHIYDGGKLAQERQSNLDQDIRQLDNELKAAFSQQSVLQSQISGNSFSSQQANQLNALNKRVIYLQNSIDALMDERTRIGTTKPQFSTKVLAELQTISLSSHREKFPVRALGATGPKSFTRGPRTVAGSMIFTVFDTNALDQFLESHPSDFDAHNPTSTALLDQIPPFDITIAFANELGQVSRMAIYGIELVNEGMTMSIEDLLLENVVQFVARDYDPMRAVSRRKLDESNLMTNQIVSLKASSLLDEEDYQTFKEGLSPFERFKRRANPFI
jgi:hypothetical protein